MRKSLNFGKNHGLSLKEKVEFLALLRTLPFWSKNHSFLPKIEKKTYFWLDYTKKPNWKEVQFFNKKPWIIPQEIRNVYFLALFETLSFRSKNHSFLSKISINHLFWLDCTKKSKMKKKFQFSTKTMDYPLRKMSISWHFLKH